MIRLICVVLGYIFGLFPTALLYGRMHGIDIRKEGSGNAGTTNTLRVLGTKAGVIVLAGDVLKCMIPVFIIKCICKESHADILPLLVVYTSAGAILGHNFPFYLKFKGGKGIAATAGMVLSMPWPFIVVEIITFFSIFFTTHYVSLGSLMVYVVLMLGCVLYGQLGFFGVAQPVLNELYIIIFLLAVMAFVKHRGNIVRLVHGEERKTYLKKKKEQE